MTVKPRIRWSAPHNYWTLYFNDQFILAGDTLSELWDDWVEISAGVRFEMLLKEHEELMLAKPSINLPPNYFDNIWIGSTEIPSYIETAEEFIEWIREEGYE